MGGFAVSSCFIPQFSERIHPYLPRKHSQLPEAVFEAIIRPVMQSMDSILHRPYETRNENRRP